MEVVNRSRSDTVVGLAMSGDQVQFVIYPGSDVVVASAIIGAMLRVNPGWVPNTKIVVRKSSDSEGK